MSLTLYSPCEMLRPYIRSFAIQETEETALYKVMPGTSAVMGFQFHGQLSIVNTADTPLAPSGITGLQDSFRLFRNNGRTGTLLVRFTETGASYFFPIPLHLLFNGSYSLKDLITTSEIAAIEEQLASASGNNQRIPIIEKWLLGRLLHRKEDLLIKTAIAKINTSGGQLRIADLAKELYISPGRLEKRFRAIVGAPLKNFAGLVRLQQVLQIAPTVQDLTSLAYQAGYFDQAHFIHDFTAYTGLPPAEFFRTH